MANADGSVRLGLLGAGRIGQVHGAALAKVAGARLVAVADAVEEAAQALANTYGAETRTEVRSSDAIVDADDIDAVLVCTPTDTHADLIEALARAGKSIFCEKPIALDLPRTRACLAVVEETGARLMLGFNRRFDTQFRALRDAVAEGRVGTPELVQITSRDPGPPPIDYIRRSGGLFKDMMIHDFDIARWLLGEEPETVSAHGSVLVDPAIGEAGDVDTACVVLETPSGRQAVITNSRRAAYGYDQRVEVHGSKGCASLANQRPSDITVAGSEGYLRPPLHDFFMTRYAGAYEAEIAAFIEVVASGKAPDPNGADGLAALTLAEAALLSVREGRRINVADIQAGR